MDKDMQNLVCGGIAGCASRTAVAPLERLKILYQVQDYIKTGSATTNNITSSNNAPKYQGLLQSLRKMGAEEGWRGYFRGNGANCARVFPYTAIQFAVFERMKPMLLSDGTSTLSPVQKLFGGALAGIASVIVTYPMDFVRARLTVQGGLSSTQYHGMWDALKGVYRTEGILGMYRGIVPTMWGVAPYVGLNFMVFESLRNSVPKDANGNPEAIYLLGCGAIAGACGQTAAYPLDLLRRRFQMSSFGGGTVQYTSTFGGLRLIVQEEGFPALYKGLMPNFIKVVPSIAIMFTTNELLKRFLKDE